MGGCAQSGIVTTNPRTSMLAFEALEALEPLEAIDMDIQNLGV